MATAMHEGTTFPQSAAWRDFHQITSMNLTGEADDTLAVYAGLCWKESQDVHYGFNEEGRVFHESVTVGAHWAVLALPQVSTSFLKTRMLLCSFIVEGWLFTKEFPLQDLYMDTLCGWPEGEQEAASRIIREVLQRRFSSPAPFSGDEYKNPTQRLIDLAVKFGDDSKGYEILRTVVKALGRYASPKDLVRMTQALSSKVPPYSESSFDAQARG